MQEIGDVSSKYQELIAKSSLVSAGSPKVYQVITEKEQSGTLTRITVGKRSESRPNKTILLVGETGVGKSTMVDALLNHSLGVKWEDDIWFQIVEEQNGDQSESQTSDVIVYQIFEGTNLPYSLTVIDTPGFGDTGGVRRDLLVSEKLLDVFKSDMTVRELHAVGLMMKSSECRVHDRLLYAFNLLTSMFGKDLERNIVALLTYSDGVTPENALKALKVAKIKCARNEKKKPVHFLFNNQQKVERTEDSKVILEHLCRITRTGMEQFSAFLENNKPQDLDETISVLKKRAHLSSCIQNLQEQIKFIELKQKETQQAQEAVRQHEKDMKGIQVFTFEVDEPYKERVPVEAKKWGIFFFSGATSCNVCEETCHYPGCTICTQPSHCEVMKSGHCTVCRGKCPPDDHVKTNWKFEIKTRKVTRTNIEMKEMYQSKTGHKKDTSLLEALQDEEKKMIEKKKLLLDEAYLHVVSLEKIALNVNSVSTYVHYDFLIEKMKEIEAWPMVKVLEKIKLRVEEGDRLSLRYMCGMIRGFNEKDSG